MKKILLIISLIFILTGCTANQIDNNYNNDEIITNNDIQDENQEEEIINTYVDDNPVKVGIYENNKLVKSYQTTLGTHKDIAVFDIYYTNVEKVTESNTKKNWNKYYKKYENIDKYKTGLQISFTTEDKEINEIILNPKGMYSMGPYLFVYLYDDVNQKDGTWYSHLTTKDFKDDTIISSVKLYLAGEGTKITSPISFTAFTYDEDDFDETGNYRGISSCSIEIKTKK